MSALAIAMMLISCHNQTMANNISVVYLRGGEIAIVDESDYPTVQGLTWYAHRNSQNFIGRNVYARCYPQVGGCNLPVLMHRMIMGDPEGMVVDHINGCGLDNRRQNLRICTAAENCQNRYPKHNELYVGVHRSGNRYTANVRIQGKQVSIGKFDTAELAAMARDSVVMFYRPQYGRTNYPADTVQPKSIEAIRAEIKTTPRKMRVGPSNKSGFIGVAESTAGRIRAYISIEGRSHSLGYYPSAQVAARAYDSAALYFSATGALKKSPGLNFPDEQTVPKAPAELRLESRSLAKGSKTSSFFGVSHAVGNKWQTCIRQNGKTIHLGRYSGEEQAAIAYDSAAKFVFGDKAQLNFPARDIPARDPSTIKPAMVARSTTGYIGVTPKRKKFVAAIFRNGTHHRVFGFATAESAALAYDAMAKYFGERVDLNFPDKEVRAASPEAVRAELRRTDV